MTSAKVERMYGFLSFHNAVLYHDLTNFPFINDISPG
jgi:hypothetical protein